MDGYTRLASLMGTHPDLAIFPRHAVLNAKNLLYMNAEISLHAADLASLAKENRDSTDPEKSDFEFSVSSLMGPHESADGQEQWKKVLEMRGMLKEYSLCQ